MAFLNSSRRVGTAVTNLVAMAVLIAGCGTPSTATATATATGDGDAPVTPAAQAASEGAVPDGTIPEDDADPGDGGPSLPVTLTDASGAEVTVESVERIIPLDGTVAEVVFALGLGDHVVATDLSATHPPEADALPEIGYQRALSAEPIVAFEPTVLLATDLAGPPETIEQLRSLGLPVVIVPNEATPEGPGEKIRAVALALGVAGRGEALADEVDRAIAEAAAPADATATGPTVAALYLRGTSAQLVLGRDAASHWLIGAAGGVDVAGELDLDEPTPISAEQLLVSAPDVLLVTTSGLESVGGTEGLLEIPGLAGTPAGEAGNVLVFDDQLLLGNGPRAAEVLAELRSQLAAVATS